MIIKKPYAFLIKNFRIIHGILFLMLTFLCIKSFAIYTFFSEYVKNHYYISTTNLASDYVSILMYVIDILSILVILIIYLVMNVKKKSNNFYLVLIGYYAVLFVYYIYMYFVFNNLSNASLSVESVRLFRDIGIIVCLPQLILLTIVGGRALGFNIKQFEFKKDLEEMDIDTSDNEEVEITLGNDSYKIARFFRKFLRLSKYFILENKFFIILLSSIVILVISFKIISNITVETIHYAENDYITANLLEYQITNSYITNTDINNNVITKDKYYVIVETKVNNKVSKDITVDRETIRLETENGLLSPILSMKNEFIDIGEVFTPTKILSGMSDEFIVIFEIDKSLIKKDYILKIKNFDSTRINVDEEYKEVVIIPKNLNNENINGNYVLPADLDFKDTFLNGTKLLISEYNISDKFVENYTFCVIDNCNQGKYTISPSKNKGNLIVMKLKTTITFGENEYIKKYISSASDLLGYYSFISYKYMGETKQFKVNIIETSYVNEKYSYVEVPYELYNAEKIDLNILIRGIKYTINLK